MKAKALLFAAALIALSACNNIFENDNPSDGNSFKQGEKVTIRVSSGEASTKVTGTDDGTDINLVWEQGDKILVTVGDDSETFTLSTGKGTSTATFTGTMPGSDSKFDIQYPATTPDLSTQTYVEGQVPSGKLTFTATGCTLDKTAELTATNSVLQLNLYGTSQTISKIVVTNLSTSATYTLNITGGKTLGTTSDTATAFYVVTDKINEKLKVTVYDNATTPAEICNFTTSNEIDLSGNNVCVNMPAKEVKVQEPVFSVSATKTVKFTRGNLYYSSTDNAYHIEDEQNVTYATLGQTEYTASHVCHFLWTNLTDYQSGTASYMPYAEEYACSTQSESDIFWCSEDNQLTVDGLSGLYALSSEEWCYLLTTRGTGDSYFKYPVTVNDGATNCLVIAPDGYSGTIASSYTAEEWAAAEADGLVCLPAAGYLYVSELSDGGSYGLYWSATPDGSSEDNANYLYFDDNNGVNPSFNNARDYGYSIRLVYNAQ